MDRNTIQNITADETIQPLEYSAHCIWAEAFGLKDLIRKATPDEIDAVRDELRQAIAMIEAELETSQ
jgi:hypothetical protein